MVYYTKSGISYTAKPLGIRGGGVSGVAGRRAAVASMRAASRAIRPAQRGYVRTSGFYGRTRGEVKFVDTSLVNAGVANTMESHNLSIIPQGDTESQRLGRKVTATKISCKGAVNLLSPTSAEGARVKIMIVQDQQTNGAQFAGTDLWETDAIDSFNNLANQSRFKTLKTKVIEICPQGAAPSGAAYVLGSRRIPFAFNVKCNVPLEYDNSATTGAITTARSNTLHFVMISDNSNVAAIAGTCRLRFKDL